MSARLYDVYFIRVGEIAEQQCITADFQKCAVVIQVSVADSAFHDLQSTCFIEATDCIGAARVLEQDIFAVVVNVIVARARVDCHTRAGVVNRIVVFATID